MLQRGQSVYLVSWNLLYHKGNKLVIRVGIVTEEINQREKKKICQITQELCLSQMMNGGEKNPTWNMLSKKYYTASRTSLSLYRIIDNDRYVKEKLFFWRLLRRKMCFQAFNVPGSVAVDLYCLFKTKVSSMELKKNTRNAKIRTEI